MALSLVNYFFFDLPGSRVPFMFVDGLVIFGLHVWERELKKRKAELQERDAIQHEVEKKASRAEKAAVRSQRKADDKKMLNKTNAHASFAPKQKIQQPDKSKKLM